MSTRHKKMPFAVIFELGDGLWPANFKHVYIDPTPGLFPLCRRIVFYWAKNQREYLAQARAEEERHLAAATDQKDV